MKSTKTHYGRVAVTLHWLSALLIILMIPMGFWMQGIEPEVKPLLYRTHVLMGLAVLGLTVLRLIWRWFDVSPDLPANLDSSHRRGYKIIHGLLYVVLLVLAGSGIALNITSGLGEILFAGAAGPIPANLSDFPARAAHGLTSRLYIALLFAHVAGVLSFQATQGDVLSRMGLPAWGVRPDTEL
jgi:cytochrome b561